MMDPITAEIKRRLPTTGRRVVFVCGLGGAGKTQFCLRYAKKAGLEGPILHVDWYLKYSTAERRQRMVAAEASGDPRHIEAEVNPISWTDLGAIARGIGALRRQGVVEIEDGWDQTTGEKTLHARLEAAETSVIWVDGIYLLHPAIASLADVTVLLEADDDAAAGRGEARDGHRNDSDYLAYKRLLKKKYDLPYFARYRDHADIVIDNNNFSRPKIVHTARL